MENVVTLPKKELTHAEAAAYLGVTVKTLYKWRQNGRGPRTIRRFGKLYYLTVDLDAFKRSAEEVREAYS